MIALLIVAFNTAISAQEKPTAYKFDFGDGKVAKDYTQVKSSDN